MLEKIERKIGKYAIKNLALIMIMTYAIGYIIEFVNPDIIYYITLDPYKILHGEVWRIISWLLIPPPEDNIFFMLIMLYFYYSISSTLERTWGTFYFNYYIFSGILFTIIGAFAFYAFIYFGDTVAIFNDFTKLGIPSALINNDESKTMLVKFLSQLGSMFFSTYFINMSIFLGFAATYPDMPILLFFILPIKVKALGIIYGVYLIYQMFQLYPIGFFIIGSSLLNFVIFYYTTRSGRRRKAKSILEQFIKKKTEEESKKKAYRAASVAKHKCAICGRTSDSHPDLEFRFCSKCEGNYEYCNDHLFTHKHVER